MLQNTLNQLYTPTLIPLTSSTYYHQTHQRIFIALKVCIDLEQILIIITNLLQIKFDLFPENAVLFVYAVLNLRLISYFIYLSDTKWNY